MKSINFFILYFFFVKIFLLKAQLVADDYIKKIFSEKYIQNLTKNDDFNGFLLEFEYNSSNSCYENKNYKDKYSLKIKKNSDGTFSKDFRDLLIKKSITESYKYNGDLKKNDSKCGHLFKLTLKGDDEILKSYIVYLSFNKRVLHDAYMADNKISDDYKDKIVEFESICVFEFIRYIDFFEDCINLEKVLLKNRKKDVEEDENYFALKLHAERVFKGCKKLKYADLSEFFLLDEQDGFFSSIFKDCEQLEKLVLNNTQDYTKFDNSFNNCKKIKEIDFIDKNKNIIVYPFCFCNCEELSKLPINLYLSNFCIGSFKNCKNLKNLKLNIDEDMFSHYYKDCKLMSKEDNLTEEQKKESDIRKYINFDDVLSGTKLDSLEINTAPNIDIVFFSDYIEKIVKSGNVDVFIFNGVSIKNGSDVNLKQFILNPAKYLSENQRFSNYKPIENKNTKKKKINDLPKGVCCCLQCCHKCCSC